MARAASPVATSMVRSARGTVEIGFIAARTRSASPVLMPPSVPPARPDTPAYAGRPSATISSWASEPRGAGQLEPVADLDALDRLDAHQRGREPGVEPAVPVHVAAEARRQAVHDDLDDAAEGVAVLARGLDLGHHRRAGARVEAAHRVGVDARPGRRAPARAGGRDRRPSATTWRQTSTPTACAQERLGHRAERDPGGGLARAGALEHRAGVVEAVLLHADEVGVAGPRPGQRRVAGEPVELLGVDRVGDITVSHLGHSLLPIADGDRPAERAAVAYAAEDLELVLLELLPRAAARAEPAAGQVDADGLACHLDPGGQTLEDREQRRARATPPPSASATWADPSDPQRGPGPGSGVGVGPGT